MIKLDDLELKRSSDLDGYMNEQEMLHWDDPEYRYLFLSDWADVREVRKNWGWIDDAFGIYFKAKRIGYIDWSHDRNQDLVKNIAVFVEPKYIGKGYGAVALLKLVQYLFFSRNVRKIRFAVCEPNVQTVKMYRRFITIAGHEVGTLSKERKLFDGTYCNEILFEVLKEDLVDTCISGFYDLVVKNER